MILFVQSKTNEANWSIKIWDLWLILYHMCKKWLHPGNNNVKGKKHTGYLWSWTYQRVTRNLKTLGHVRREEHVFLHLPGQWGTKKLGPVLIGAFNNPHSSQTCFQWPMFALRRNSTKDSLRICRHWPMWVTRGVKQMWCVWVTLITSRFIQARISLVCLISGHCLKVKVGHSHYVREHNTIIHTIQ